MDGKHKQAGAGPRVRGVWRSMVPVGVATMIAFGIAGFVDLVHAHQNADDGERAAKPAAERQSTEPRRFVGVQRDGTALVVRDLRTGGTVGVPVAAPPGRRFQRIASSGEGEYVVASYASRRITFQRLALDKEGRPEGLADIPRAVVPGVSAAWSEMAVHPDGDRIAYVTYQGMTPQVQVVSAKTGQRKMWRTSSPARVASLSWAGDTLNFLYTPARPGATKAAAQMRALNTAGRSGDLRASTPVLKLPSGTGAALSSRDGRTVVAGLTARGQLSLQTYTVQNRQPGKVLWKQSGATSRLVRIVRDHTGKHLLAFGADGRLYADGAPPLRGADLIDVAW
ncbi:hypothetical protein [Actinomadura keratinilytica]|jgi:hypothetical protein|uniref:WD40 repeat domain-containing protein n=2 Tax=Actinomadura keratinilytica TaxID=547461 RepID=A0ABP7Y7Z8_9ACTN